MNYPLLFLLCLLVAGCQNDSEYADDRLNYLSDEIPEDQAVTFLPGRNFDGELVHRAIFSPDYQHCFLTISDQAFNQFDVMTMRREDDRWSEPEDAFFNSSYNDHGMSFSPDGQTLFFSSTRPTGREDVAATWHIWRSDWVEGQWTEPTYVDIPNLRDKLCSHPSATENGTLYFHSSNADYSEMELYYSTLEAGSYQAASRVDIPGTAAVNKCTPFVDPGGQFLLYAIIGDQLELAISRKGDDGNWQEASLLPESINSDGQGNPYLSPDGKYLFFATGTYAGEDWKMNWVRLNDNW